ncbi:hypothetical protein VNO77_15064 [Canavalia gladiata]|uniref:Uncharacterized protein n=1 Tax=Canavalia gladiata TaxID=3824 RepID=A0AAN9M3Z3_CANGL
MVQKFVEEDHEKRSAPIRRHHRCIYLNGNSDDSSDDDSNAPCGSGDPNGSSGEASGILKGQAARFGIGKRYSRAARGGLSELREGVLGARLQFEGFRGLKCNCGLNNGKWFKNASPRIRRGDIGVGGPCF